MIAVFPNLQNLNGCSLTANERKHAERYFIALATRKSQIIADVDPNDEHSKRLEQLHQTGFFAAKPEEFGLAKNKAEVSIEVKIEPIGSDILGLPTITKRLPLWLKVSDLRLICQKLFKLTTSRRLSMCNRSIPAPVELDDNFTLDFYGLDENCKILIGEPD